MMKKTVIITIFGILIYKEFCVHICKRTFTGTFIKNFHMSFTVILRDIKGTYYYNIHLKVRRLSLRDYLQAK